jgi:hypothetical protein
MERNSRPAFPLIAVGKFESEFASPRPFLPSVAHHNR